MTNHEKQSQRVRVSREFECRRVADDVAVAPQQIIVYPAEWVGLMPGHHVAAGLALDAIEIIEDAEV